MVSITYSDRFIKSFKKLTKNEKKQFWTKLEKFIKDKTEPSLRTKKIKGSTGMYEFSVNMDIRVIWYYEGVELVMLVDIGHHDILKKY